MIVLTVFGSSRPAPGSDAYETARALGAALARAGFAVATGGYGGTMEGTSRGAREAGGKTLGVTAEVFRSAANAWVEEEIRVKTWHDRLLKLVELGAGYVVLPGGTGTLVELAVVWEWISKRFLPVKPLIILGEFWLPVVNAIPAVELHSNPILRARTVEEAVELLHHHLGHPQITRPDK
ncbi:MAG: LOG family protein [Terriglobia bacterium]